MTEVLNYFNHNARDSEWVFSSDRPTYRVGYRRQTRAQARETEKGPSIQRDWGAWVFWQGRWFW